MASPPMALTGRLFFLWVFFSIFFAFQPADAQTSDSIDIGGRVLSSPLTIDIFNIVESNITSGSADISWETDILSQCRFFYGETLIYELGIIEETGQSIMHVVSLSDLDQATTYYYRIFCWSGPRTGEENALDFTTGIDPPDFVVDVSGQTAVLDGTGPPGSTIHLTIFDEEGGIMVATVLADDFGRWQYVSPILDFGPYSAVAYASLNGWDSVNSQTKYFEVVEEGGEGGGGGGGNGGGGGGEDPIPPGETDSPEETFEEVPAETEKEQRNNPFGKDPTVEYGGSSLATSLLGGLLDLEALIDLESWVRENRFALTLLQLVTIIIFGALTLGKLTAHLVSASRVMLAFFRAASFLPAVLARKKKQGLVYDAESGAPIEAAQVIVVRKDGKEDGTEMADKFGAFSFVLGRGKYSVRAEKTGYRMLSRMEVAPSPALYELSYGEKEELEIGRKKELKISIPMKKISQRSALEVFFFQPRFYFISDGVFWLGLAVSSLITYVWPVWINFLILALYPFFFWTRAASIARPKWGAVSNLEGLGEAGAKVEVFADDTDRFRARTVADKDGKYILVLEQGEYLFRASGPNRLRGETKEKISQKQVGGARIALKNSPS